MIGVGVMLGGDRLVLNKAIAGYAFYIASAWDQHDIMQVPGNCGSLEAMSGEKIILYFHCLYKEELLDRRGGGRHPWRCCVDHYCATV